MKFLRFLTETDEFGHIAAALKAKEDRLKLQQTDRQKGPADASTQQSLDALSGEISRSAERSSAPVAEDGRAGEIGPDKKADADYDAMRASNKDLQSRIARANVAPVYECPLCGKRGLDKRCTNCHTDKTLVKEAVTIRSTTYRDKEGFSIHGDQAKIFTKSKEKAERIADVLRKQEPGESRSKAIDKILLEETNWLNTLTQDTKQRVFALMRRYDERYESHRSQSDRLSPRNGEISVGGGQFDEFQRSEVIRDFLSHIRKGVNPKDAAERTSAYTAEMASKWNAHRGKDYQTHRSSGGQEPFIMDMMRAFLNAAKLTEDYTGAPEYKTGKSPMTVATEAPADSGDVDMGRQVAQGDAPVNEAAVYRCTNGKCDYRGEKGAQGKCPGCGKPTSKVVSEGEPTQSAGSLFGGPSGSIGEKATKESDLSMQGFTSFNERMSGYTDVLTGKVKQPKKPTKKAVKEAGVAPVYEVYDSRGNRLLTHVPPRPLGEDTYAIPVTPKISEENKWRCPSCHTWTTDPMGKACLNCKRAGWAKNVKTMTEAIGAPPTRTGFFKGLVNDLNFRKLPVRYRQESKTLQAESQDKGTLHRIAMHAHEEGLQTEMKKSEYEWDSTWVMTVSGFRS